VDELYAVPSTSGKNFCDECVSKKSRWLFFACVLQLKIKKVLIIGCLFIDSTIVGLLDTVVGYVTNCQ
jgi:hypothetical protein